MICFQSVKYNSCQCLPDSYEEQRYLLHSYDITVGGKRNAVMVKSNNCCVSLGHSGFVFELEETSLLFIFFLQKKSPPQRPEICFSDWGKSSDSFRVLSLPQTFNPTMVWSWKCVWTLFLWIKDSTLQPIREFKYFPPDLHHSWQFSGNYVYQSVHPDQPIKIFCEIKFQQSVMTSVGIWAVS